MSFSFVAPTVSFCLLLARLLASNNKEGVKENEHVHPTLG